MNNMAETVEVTITVPKKYMDFLHYLLDDNPDTDIDEYFEKLLRSDIDNIITGPQLNAYLVPKIKATFPGIVEEV